MVWQILIGFSLSTSIAILAHRAGALDWSGALAAFMTGGLIFGLGGISWAALLLAFFVSSSGLSFAFSQRKVSLGEKFAKGASRDWGQVLANGGLGALLVVVHGLDPRSVGPWLAYAGAIAAVNADTWATELGVLSPSPPRRITTGQVVEPGASGGITPAGTLASLLGAGLIGGLAVAVRPVANAPAFLLAVTLAGLAGSLFDSLLGATLQAIYHCPACSKETERHPVHVCGTLTHQTRGWRWLNNDLVNLAASILGAAVASAAWRLVQG